MSNSDSNKKQLPKKTNNSYSLLLMSMSEGQKSQKTSTSVKKSSSSGVSDKSKTMDSGGKQKDPPTSKNLQEKSAPVNKNKLEDQGTSKNDVPAEDLDPDLPDRSYGDYYCKMCDSHMNSDNMWEAHVTGKRHIKNVKKGDTDSKYEDLPNVESNIKYEIRNVKDPIVGLSYIHEIRRREPNVPPMYNCFLCHASIATVPLVIEHVISLKHRFNYIKETNPEEYQLIEGTNLKKGHMEPLVLAAATDLEQRFGRGTVKVKQEKKKALVSTWSAKKSYKDDDNDIYRKMSRPDNISVWKSVDTSNKILGRDVRSRSPRDTVYRKRSAFSDDEFSMGDYKRSRDISPRRDDYYKSHSRQCDDYSRKVSDYDDFSSKSRYDDMYETSYSKKSDSYDRPNYKFLSEYERNSLDKTYPSSPPQDPVKKSTDYHRSGSYISQDVYLLPQEKSVRKNASQDHNLEDFLKSIFALSNDIFLKISYSKMESMELKRIDDLVQASKIITLLQGKLQAKLPPDFIVALKERSQKGMNHGQSSIPGLGDFMSSPGVSSGSVNPETRFKSSNVTDAQSFINEIFKSVNATPPVNQRLSLAQNANFQNPAINAMQPPPILQPPPVFQPPPFQTPRLNSYQNPANSFLHSNANIPFASGSSNFPLNNAASGISGLGNKSAPMAANYNYQPYSSSSPASKKFPRKY